MQHHKANVNGIDLHYVEEGSGPLVVFLHGFPEFWFSWRRQIPALAAAGFRVVALDLRGFNDSSTPSEVDAYKLKTVVADVAALIEHLGAPAVLVGHDWGGLTAWFLAMSRPELLRKLVVLNMPHPVPFLRELRRDRGQRLRMAYQLFLRLPVIPELLMPLLLPLLLRVAGRFKADEIAEYRRAWRKPGVRRGMANYYRAVPRGRGELKQLTRPIELPTLLIWGEKEIVFTPATTENFDEWVPNLTIEKIARAGHFVQTDQPDLVNDALLNFLRA